MASTSLKVLLLAVILSLPLSEAIFFLLFPGPVILPKTTEAPKTTTEAPNTTTASPHTYPSHRKPYYPRHHYPAVYALPYDEGYEESEEYTPPPTTTPATTTTTTTTPAPKTTVKHTYPPHRHRVYIHPSPYFHPPVPYYPHHYPRHRPPPHSHYYHEPEYSNTPPSYEEPDEEEESPTTLAPTTKATTPAPTTPAPTTPAPTTPAPTTKKPRPKRPSYQPYYVPYYHGYPPPPLPPFRQYRKPPTFSRKPPSDINETPSPKEEQMMMKEIPFQPQYDFDPNEPPSPPKSRKPAMTPPTERTAMFVTPIDEGTTNKPLVVPQFDPNAYPDQFQAPKIKKPPSKQAMRPQVPVFVDRPADRPPSNPVSSDFTKIKMNNSPFKFELPPEMEFVDNDTVNERPTEAITVNSSVPDATSANRRQDVNNQELILIPQPERVDASPHVHWNLRDSIQNPNLQEESTDTLHRIYIPLNHQSPQDQLTPQPVRLDNTFSEHWNLRDSVDNPNIDSNASFDEQSFRFIREYISNHTQTNVA